MIKIDNEERLRELVLNGKLKEESQCPSTDYISLCRLFQRLSFNLVKCLIAAVEAKGSFIRGHSARVTMDCMAMAKELSLPALEIEKVQLTALLHDIGKIGIPDSILQKPGKLTDEERAIVKEHPVIGAKILKSITDTTGIVPGVLHHHERYDGKGYPQGLAGKDIPLSARIIAVADTFDAMTCDHSFRSRFSTEETIKEIQWCAGSQFDPEIVKVFLKIYRRNYDYDPEMILWPF